jgi:hypothetical protein
MERPWLVVATFCALMACLGPQAAYADLRDRCPGAASWEASHSDESPDAMAERDKHRAISNPQLLSELQRRVDQDQEARRSWLRSPSVGKPRGRDRFRELRLAAQSDTWRGLPDCDRRR